MAKRKQLDLSRTRAALAIFDQIGDKLDRDDPSVTWADQDNARVNLARAFAKDTSDRNDEKDVMEFVTGCIAGLTFVRMLCKVLP